jgi:hypothetical protein
VILAADPERGRMLLGDAAREVGALGVAHLSERALALAAA